MLSVNDGTKTIGIFQYPYWLCIIRKILSNNNIADIEKVTQILELCKNTSMPSKEAKQ